MDSYGILGRKIGHSISPTLQNQAYKAHDIAAQFLTFEVEPEDLAEKIVEFKNSDIKGLIVTIPYKEQVAQYLDRLDRTAQKSGVVNVIEKIGNEYVGYNFDGIAWLSGVYKEFNLQTLASMSVLLIGFGGVAQSIYTELLQFKNIQITIVNRTIEKLKNSIDNPMVKIKSFDEFTGDLSNYDLVIQTTPVGMWPQIDQTPMEITKVKTNAIYSDVIYNPFQTAFLKQAEQLGAKTQNGMPMLVEQNEKVIEMWFGKQVKLTFNER